MVFKQLYFACAMQTWEKNIQISNLKNYQHFHPLCIFKVCIDWVIPKVYLVKKHGIV